MSCRKSGIVCEILDLDQMNLIDCITRLSHCSDYLSYLGYEVQLADHETRVHAAHRVHGRVGMTTVDQWDRSRTDLINDHPDIFPVVLDVLNYTRGSEQLTILVHEPPLMTVMERVVPWSISPSTDHPGEAEFVSKYNCAMQDIIRYLDKNGLYYDSWSSGDIGIFSTSEGYQIKLLDLNGVRSRTDTDFLPAWEYLYTSSDIAKHF